MVLAPKPGNGLGGRDERLHKTYAKRSSLPSYIRLLPVGRSSLALHCTRATMDDGAEGIFKHDPLPLGDDSMRYLVLEPPRNFDSEIKCQVVHGHIARHGSGPYEALSYVWGSQEHRVKITCNGKPFYVTTNCPLALRYLRKKKGTRLLWVGAICIDQLSNSERGHQVERIGEIYWAARNVIIWLGEEQDSVKKAFRHARLFFRLTPGFEKAKALIGTFPGSP